MPQSRYFVTVPYWEESRTVLTVAVAVLVFGAMWIPVRQSVLAPAEIVPLEPTVVRAPLDGVVERIVVQPNQDVAAGEVLLTLDPTQIRNRLDVARMRRKYVTQRSC